MSDYTAEDAKRDVRAMMGDYHNDEPVRLLAYIERTSALVEELRDSYLESRAKVYQQAAEIERLSALIERLTAAVRMNDSIVDDLQHASYQRDQYRAEVEQLRKVAEADDPEPPFSETVRLDWQLVNGTEESPLHIAWRIRRDLRASLPHKEGEHEK